MKDESRYHHYLNDQNNDLTDKEAKDFLDKSSHAQIPPSNRKDEIWDNIDQATRRNNQSWYWMAAAAVSIILMGYWFLLRPNALITHQTGLAELNTIELPDGSLVQLSAATNLNYERKWKERRLQMEGEAFFEVQKGEKFTVVTEVGEVTVLGTSFNVLSRDKKLEVACKTGKVMVSIPSSQFSDIILPGESIRIDQKEIKLNEVSVDKIGSWKNGEFYFEYRPVIEVFEEIERQFGVKLDTEGLEHQFFTGYFTNEELPTALTMVCAPLELSFIIKSDNQVSIRPAKGQ